MSASADPMTDPMTDLTQPAPPSACANCGFAFGTPPPRYCPDCGQESRVRPPRLMDFLQQFGGAYLSTEGALWRTLKLLLIKPGELTRQYLAGRRVHYVLPLRLYLTISVLVLLLMRAVGSSGPVDIDIQVDDATKPARPQTYVVLGLGKDGEGIGVRDGVFFCNGVPEWVCKRIQRRFNTDPKALARTVEDFRDRFLGNLGGMLFLLLPSFALSLKLVYLNRRMRYTEHLVFALHVHAFWFVALLLALPEQAWLKGLASFLVPWYTLAAMRRVYGGRRWPRWLRAGVVSMLYLFAMTLALVAVVLWTLIA